jgi:hypothetical protein
MFQPIVINRFSRVAQNMLRPRKHMTKAKSIHQTPMRSLALLGFVFATACASFPPPTESLANAIASVRGAEEVGAADVPEAALQLQLAREEITKARALMAQGDNEPAHYQALRAANDADLAIALVRANQAHKAAEAAEENVEKIKAEVNP